MSYYRPPGVYPEKLDTAGLVALWQGARIPVIIGRGQRTIEATATITSHNAGGTDTLPIAATSIIRIGDYVDQVRYAETTDYLFTGDTTTPSTDIVWTPSGREPAAAATYFVTYRKLVPSDQYDFKMYTDENEIARVHGPESTTNLATVGGIVALRQGCPAVGIIQLNLESTGAYPTGGPDNPTSADYYTAFINALDILEQLDTDQCRYVVPMTTLDSETYPIISDYLDHVDTMSLTSQRRWRMLVAGRAASEDATNATVRDAFAAQATTYRSHESARRMILVGPGEVYRIIRDATTGVATRTLFGGDVLAAATAGRVCADRNPAVPITMKKFGSFQVGRTFSNADMNYMAGNGVCLYFYKGTALKCRHAITTDLTDANTQEISVVEIEDYIKIQSIFILEDRYIGSLFSEEITASVQASIMASWELLIEQQTIADYDAGSVSVEADPNDPRICNIYGRIKPMYPLNWIDVKFRFYAGTGD